MSRRTRTTKGLLEAVLEGLTEVVGLCTALEEDSGDAESALQVLLLEFALERMRVFEGAWS